MLVQNLERAFNTPQHESLEPYSATTQTHNTISQASVKIGN